MSNHIFSFLATPVFAYIHIQHQPCPYVNLQHNYSLVSNNNFTFNANIHVHFLQPIWHLFCVLFYQQPPATILPQLFNTHFCQHFLFFQPCASATQQPIPLFIFATFRQQATTQLIFFANCLPPAIFLQTSKHFQLIFCLIPRPLFFFWSDVLSADCPSWRGAM